jgi:LPXTG-motif cell wall-anchored protein
MCRLVGDTQSLATAFIGLAAIGVIVFVVRRFRW